MTMTKTLQPKKKTGAFSAPLDIQMGDRLRFAGERVSIFRRGKRVCLACWRERELEEADRIGTLEKDAGESEPKKQYPPIPEGARWITVNPSGQEGAGVHVLMMPHEDGTATVIGGAGGKLNMLKLHSVKSPEEWEQRRKERAAQKKEKERQRSEAMTDEQKQQEKEDLAKVKEYKQTATHQNALETLAILDNAGLEYGLTPEHKQALQMPPDPGAEADRVAEWERLTREATQKIKAIHQAYEQKLVTDHEARSAALLADGDLETDNRVVENQGHTAADADGNSLSEIVALPGGGWIVNGPNGPETFDNWKDAAKEHVRNVLLAEQEMGGDRTQPDSFYSPAGWVKDVQPEQLPEGFEFKPEMALQIAKLSAERKAVDRQAKQAEIDIKKRDPLEIGSGYDMGPIQKLASKEVAAKLESEAKLLKDAFINNRFLELIKDQGDAQDMQKHYQVGGYAGLSEVASEVLKQNPISRSLVDAIGHNEASKVLAYMMRQNLTPTEYERVSAAIAAYHAQTSTNFARGATKQTEKLQERLKGIHEEMLALSEFAEGDLDPVQQLQMDSLAYEASSLKKSIQQILGTSLGKLQATAAMVAALEAKPKTLHITGKNAEKLTGAGLGGEADAGETPEGDDLTDDRGDGNRESHTPGLLEAYGLSEDDYEATEDGIVINESGLQKLAVGYNPEDKEAYERAIAIKRGDMDEEGFVPDGFSHYTTVVDSNALNDAQQFDTSFELLGKLAAAEGAGEGTLSLFGDPEPAAADIPDEEVESGLRSYIGARVANGENPLDVMNDVRSPEFYMQQGLDPYGASALRVQGIASDMVKRVAGGGNISDKAIRDAFQAMGDEEAAKQRKLRQTDDLQALHAQKLDNQEGAIEAMHRTLAAMPMARTVFKPWSELNRKERQWLREYGITEVLGQELEAPKEKAKKEDSEPEAEMQADIFGNLIAASEVAAQQRGEEKEYSQWENFSKLMGGDDKAFAAVRDHLKGKLLHRFAGAYASITGKAPLFGGETISNVDRLLLAKLPENERNEMLEFMRSRQQSDVASARSRVGGKFASEMDDAWMEKYEALKGNNRQISLLSADSGRSTPKTDYQRTTLGTAAEAQLHDIAQKVLGNFEQINAPVDIIQGVNWGAGTQHVMKQRVLKMLEAQKKIGLFAGAGSGKSATMLGCFSHLHAQGKVKKALIAVPSSIVGQFVGEAVTFLQPGKYNYNANLGMSREERIAAYTDPNVHIHVTTRESLSNDLLYLVEKHLGVDPERYRELSEREQKELMLSACQKEGIDTEGLLLSVDESHDLLARKGVDPAKRSIALKTLGHHAGHYIEATGSPQKNDPSEFYSFLHAVAPDKFNDLNKFMAEYGQNTEASKRALQRAIAPYAISFATKPQNKKGETLRMNEFQPKVTPSDYIASERQRILDDIKLLSDWQSQRREELTAEHGEGYQPSTEDFNTAWEVPAIREALDRLGSDNTWGAMDEAGKQQSIGGQIMALGGLKRVALYRLYHLAPPENNPKVQWTVDHAINKFKNEGKPGIVFTSSSAMGEMMVNEFKKRGMRVAYIHGGLDGTGKDKERIKFQSDNPEADILICTDAARTGVNLTRGKVLYHADVPLTYMGYEQRSARIHRLKQSVDSEIYTPMLDAPEEQIAFSRMQRKGKSAKPLQQRSETIDETGLARMIKERRSLVQAG